MFEVSEDEEIFPVYEQYVSNLSQLSFLMISYQTKHKMERSDESDRPDAPVEPSISYTRDKLVLHSSSVTYLQHLVSTTAGPRLCIQSRLSTEQPYLSGWRGP